MKRKLRKFTLLMLTIFTFTTVLSGCSDGKKNETGKENSSASNEAVNEISVGIAQDLDDSLDPHKVTAAGTREVLFNIFEGLVKPDPDGNIIPAVAESYVVSESGIEYTFTMREGVLFHNGDAVTADDIVYSIKRCAGLLEGEEIPVTALSSVTGVEAKDDKTIVITIAEKNLEFIANLATTNAAIIPADYADQATMPVGTGPFKYVSRAPQENVIMEKFEDYWGENAYLDKVTYKIITDPSSGIMALKSGAIDIYGHLNADRVKELEGDFDIYEDTMKLVQAIYLNNNYEPLSDKRVRQAMCYAVNVDEIIEIVSDGRGVKVGSSMFPAFGKYFDESLGDTYNYDPEKAKELLAEAGYENGFDLVVTVPSNYTPHVDAGQMCVEYLRAVGINATIEQVEWATWVSRVYTDREFQATVVGVDASTMTARAMLERFVSDYPKNFINYENSEYDEVFAKAIASTDDAEQVGYYKELQKILAEDAANVYIQDLCDMYAVNKKLTGFRFYPIYVLDLSTVRFIEQ